MQEEAMKMGHYYTSIKGREKKKGERGRKDNKVTSFIIKIINLNFVLSLSFLFFKFFFVAIQLWKRNWIPGIHGNPMESDLISWMPGGIFWILAGDFLSCWGANRIRKICPRPVRTPPRGGPPGWKLPASWKKSQLVLYMTHVYYFTLVQCVSL